MPVPYRALNSKSRSTTKSRVDEVAAVSTAADRAVVDLTLMSHNQSTRGVDRVNRVGTLTLSVAVVRSQGSFFVTPAPSGDTNKHCIKLRSNQKRCYQMRFSSSKCMEIRLQQGFTRRPGYPLPLYTVSVILFSF